MNLSDSKNGRINFNSVMRKNLFPFLVIAGISALGLIIWNVYLIQQIDQLKKVNDDLELKIQMLEGDNDVLMYDLVTVRDSVRILNEKRE
jgi:hypothetical protein